MNAHQEKNKGLLLPWCRGTWCSRTPPSVSPMKGPTAGRSWEIPRGGMWKKEDASSSQGASWSCKGTC